jgi:hypothetical protein
MKTYILLSIMLLSTVATFAQSKHQVNIGYGNATLDHARKDFFRVTKEFRMPDDLNQPTTETANILFGVPASDLEVVGPKRTGAVVLSYRYGLLKWLSVGIAAGYEQEARMVNFIDRTNNNRRVDVGNFKRNVYTIAAELQPIYKRFPMATLYGIFGVGNGFINEKVTNSTTSKSSSFSGNETAVQLTPFAISVGKKLRGFAEFGYGYKGMMHVGVGYEF